MTADQRNEQALEPDDDFDAWFAAAAAPYRVRLLGRVWELPAEIPARKVDRYRRVVQWLRTVSEDDAGEATSLPDGFTPADLEWEAVARDLAGPELVDQWLDAGLQKTLLDRVAAALVDRYVLGGPGFTAFQDALRAADHDQED